jgi:hypothetical protein
VSERPAGIDVLTVAALRDGPRSAGEADAERVRDVDAVRYIRVSGLCVTERRDAELAARRMDVARVAIAARPAAGNDRHDDVVIERGRIFHRGERSRDGAVECGPGRHVGARRCEREE